MRTIALRPLPADIVMAGRRIEERAGVDLPAVLHSEGTIATAGRATDVGTMGCRFDGPSPLQTGSHVTVVLADATIIGGHVAWARSGALGIEFSHRLMPKAFARLTAAAG